jgi:hypothetical protein
MFNTILRWTLLILLVALCVLYTGDYAVLRIRMVRGGAGAVTQSVTVIYGAALKDGRINLFTDQPQSETCVRSIFPHLGYDPCWYAQRHPVKVIS